MKSDIQKWQQEAEVSGQIIADKEVHIDNLIRRLHELEHLLVNANTVQAETRAQLVQSQETELEIRHQLAEKNRVEQTLTSQSELQQQTIEELQREQHRIQTQLKQALQTSKDTTLQYQNYRQQAEDELKRVGDVLSSIEQSRLWRWTAPFRELHARVFNRDR